MHGHKRIFRDNPRDLKSGQKTQKQLERHMVRKKNSGTTRETSCQERISRNSKRDVWPG
jgi:hypothetical protein